MPFTRTFSAREDSGSANNPALNLTTAPAVELAFVAETDSGGAGDLFLDQPIGGGVDPDTQVEINGTSYSFTFELSGTMPTQNRDGAQQVPNQYEGTEVVIVTVQDYPTAGETTRFAFMPNETATLADMDDFGNGAIDVQNVDETPSAAPICFSKGTVIAGAKGAIKVEDLKVGDLVQTYNAGMQPVRWIGHSTYSWPGASEDFKPILIAAGSLGEGRPLRDLTVSPQHRMLLKGQAVERTFRKNEVLAPAKGLVGLRGVRVMKGKRDVTYYHILLEQHCVIEAEGALTESFFPGQTAMKLMNRQQSKEILTLFPDLKANPVTGYGSSARQCLTRKETAHCVQELQKLDGAFNGLSTSQVQQCRELAVA